MLFTRYIATLSTAILGFLVFFSNFPVNAQNLPPVMQMETPEQVNNWYQDCIRSGYDPWLCQQDSFDQMNHLSDRLRENVTYGWQNQLRENCANGDGKACVELMVNPYGDPAQPDPDWQLCEPGPHYRECIERYTGE